MAMDTVDLLLHPVRLRIVHAFSSDRALTTAEVAARMPEVSQATVYRHIGVLAEAGVLDVQEEHRVRGAVERRYRLRPDRPAIDGAAAAAMSPVDHQRAFGIAMATLIAEFNAYLERDGADPIADAVGYRQIPLWLSKDDLAAIQDGTRRLLAERLQQGPAADRKRYLLSPVLFPIEP